MSVRLPVRLSVRLSVRPSVRLKLKISVTTSGYIHIGPVVVLSYFLGGWDTPNPPPPPNYLPPNLHY